CISFSALLRSESGELPYRMWLPGNVSSVYLFSLTYVQQVLALIAGSLMHVACDCLVCGLLIHTYSQIEILGSRLKTIKNGEKKSLISCVRYHERVYRFAKMLNAKFTMVIFVQFTVSTLAVCFNLYLLTTTESVNAQLLKIIMYTCCILTQIFAYCWCGNEVKSKSLDLPNTIFESDWTMLDNNAKRVLMVIMRRATVPIEFTSIYIVPMNLETFVSILKTSYSAYNVLQRGKG
ncbi:odorant receptor 10-like, partial [Colletes latitarsis]|uniref:odorant receptor 10-like n=1 Tax=Colletes latitarsis TaxID=2605962 RepID=UPI004035CBD7